jgi:hypothetical protein
MPSAYTSLSTCQLGSLTPLLLIETDTVLETLKLAPFKPDPFAFYISKQKPHFIKK